MPIENGVEWRRARVYADGTFGTHFHFRFRWDFTAANPPNLQDAYFGLRELPIPTLQIMVGRFRAPLGLEGYTAADSTTFMERSLTSAFLPSRNTGLLFSGDMPRKKIRWAVGIPDCRLASLILATRHFGGRDGLQTRLATLMVAMGYFGSRHDLMGAWLDR